MTRSFALRNCDVLQLRTYGCTWNVHKHNLSHVKSNEEYFATELVHVCQDYSGYFKKSIIVVYSPHKIALYVEKPKHAATRRATACHSSFWIRTLMLISANPVGSYSGLSQSKMNAMLCHGTLWTLLIREPITLYKSCHICLLSNFIIAKTIVPSRVWEGQDVQLHIMEYISLQKVRKSSAWNLYKKQKCPVAIEQLHLINWHLRFGVTR